MLVCPNCQFPNPASNRFCQKCGASLASKSCPFCNASIELSHANCPACGKEVGTFWWAAIARIPNEPKPIGAEDDDRTQPNEPSLSIDTTGGMLLPRVGEYLDPLQKRYRVVRLGASQHAFGPSGGFIAWARVLDCEPLQAPGTFGREISGAAAELARPYLELGARHNGIIPNVREIWQDGRRAILLLEDRSRCPSLSELLSRREIGYRELLQWWSQMLDLWLAFLPWQCERSLLSAGNLRANGDRGICLQRLEVTPSKNPTSLVELIGAWKKMLDLSELTQPQAVVDFFETRSQERVLEAERLRARVEHLQQNLFSPTIDIDADGNTETFAYEEDIPTIGLFSPQILDLESAGLTHQGRREQNEDNFATRTQVIREEDGWGEGHWSDRVSAKGIYILCDGMGGHEGGEVASALAVETLKTFFQERWTGMDLPDESTIREGIALANEAIYQQNQAKQQSGTGRMGTTLVLVLVRDTQFAVAHVGDSRLYRFDRGGLLHQVTTDHDVGQRAIQQGIAPELAYARPDAYQLTQALGPRSSEYLNADVQFFQATGDLLLLLASDGLTDNDLLEKYSQEYLRALLEEKMSLSAGARYLIDLANQHNGHDNITTVLVRVRTQTE